MKNVDNQIAGFIRDERANALVANDETLMAIYPKIRGVPDELKKAQVREAGQK